MYFIIDWTVHDILLNIYSYSVIWIDRLKMYNQGVSLTLILSLFAMLSHSLCITIVVVRCSYSLVIKKLWFGFILGILDRNKKENECKFYND